MSSHFCVSFNNFCTTAFFIYLSTPPAAGSGFGYRLHPVTIKDQYISPFVRISLFAKLIYTFYQETCCLN